MTDFASPHTVDEAVGILSGASGAAHVLAGGTDLVVQMSSGLRKPALVVDIKGIEELKSISEGPDGFRIGAAVCGAEINEHAGLLAAWPGFCEATDLIGSMQIQSRATPAGNLCNASPAADSVPAMIAAGATVTIAGPDGQRTIPVEEVPTGPGKTSLARGEFIVSVNLPPKQARSGDAYLRFIPRTEMDIAVASAGVSLELNADGTVKAARIALGAVAPTVVLAEEAAACLIGTKLTDEALVNMAKACEAVCNPIDDKRGTIEYRTKTAGTLARRAALIAYARAGGSK